MVGQPVIRQCRQRSFSQRPIALSEVALDSLELDWPASRPDAIDFVDGVFYPTAVGGGGVVSAEPALRQLYG
jgi:hypothetical protein